MRKILPVAFALLFYLAATSYGQTPRMDAQGDVSTFGGEVSNPLVGTWVYRSYHNRPDVIIDDDPESANKALSLLFGEATMTVDHADTKSLTATFDMGSGFVLDMEGTIRWQTYVSPTIVELVGKGRAGTPTDGWQYDYIGYLAWEWPTGVGQIPAIVGTVIRTKPHGTAPAGYTASFILLKKN